MNYRAKRIENEDDKYWENNAACMKGWRDKNPVKVEQIKEEKNKN